MDAKTKAAVQKAIANTHLPKADTAPWLVGTRAGYDFSNTSNTWSRHLGCARLGYVREPHIVFKKACIRKKGDCYSRTRFVIVALELPIGARVHRAWGPMIEDRKSRSSHAKVLGFFNMRGKPVKLEDNERVMSWRTGRDAETYVVGHRLSSKNGNKRVHFAERYAHCAEGIHWFERFKDAKDYCFT